MVGILTFHFAHNYGAMLQAYALQHYLQKRGIENEIIDYRSDKMFRFYSMDFKQTKVYKVPIRWMKNHRRRYQAKIFENFINTKLVCTDRKSKAELPELSEKYIGIIVGSDQIWNTEITGNDTTYFLDFCGKDIQKIGYAVSIGNPNPASEVNDNIELFAKKFTRLSMREDSGAKRVKNIANVDTPVVCDPVFLLGQEEWRQVERKPNSLNGENYILYYSLTSDQELDKKTESLSQRTGLNIVSVHPMCNKAEINCTNLVDVGPQEFLWLLNHAGFVCSNSFHATAFSCIFGKQAVIVPNPKSADRSRQLLDLVRPIKEGEIFDFRNCDRFNLEKLISESEQYLEFLETIE